MPDLIWTVLQFYFFIHFSSAAQLCLTVCNSMDCSTQASLSITNSQSLLKLMSIESMIPSNNLILRRPLLLLPSSFPSIRVFSNELVLCIRWPKYWSFSISPSNEYSGLISFRRDWFDLLAVQGTLKSHLQHHSLKASVLSVLSLLFLCYFRYRIPISLCLYSLEAQNQQETYKEMR